MFVQLVKPNRGIIMASHFLTDGGPRSNETATRPSIGESHFGMRVARGARGVDGCGDGRGVLRMRAEVGLSTWGVQRLEDLDSGATGGKGIGGTGTAGERTGDTGRDCVIERSVSRASASSRRERKSPLLTEIRLRLSGFERARPAPLPVFSSLLGTPLPL